MLKFGIIGIAAIAGAVSIYKLIKEIKYLDNVAKDMANIHIRMEILYSKVMDKLTREGLTDRARLTAIWDCLSGYRPATI